MDASKTVSVGLPALGITLSRPAPLKSAFVPLAFKLPQWPLAPDSPDRNAAGLAGSLRRDLREAGRRMLSS